ncbi:MAG: DNA-processing protein DprA [Pseudomonadota bacterium]
MSTTQPPLPDLNPSGSRDWLRLVRLTGLGTNDKRALVSNLGSPGAIFEMDRTDAAQILRRDIADTRTKLDLDDARIDEDERILQKLGARFLPYTDPGFPSRLNAISAAPLGLFVRGDVSVLSAPQLAIVGSRQPTPAGAKTAEQFAEALANSGLTITSGMALGIDTAAHRGALSGSGHTVAVVATGIDRVYPRQNVSLHEQILLSGAVVSEFPPGSQPLRSHFPQRNRLISGLAMGTLVVEAGLRSGSLITARNAGEQGREVFAIPGSIHVPTSRGCHFLIRNGAKLVESTTDILDEIGHQFVSTAAIEKTTKSAEDNVDEDVFELFTRIDFTPTPIEQLIEQSGLTPEEVSYILMTLEMKGLIASSPAGYQRLPN